MRDNYDRGFRIIVVRSDKGLKMNETLTNKINISHCINLEECFIHNDYNNDTLTTMAVRQRQSEITKHLYDNYISDAVFLSECDSEGKCRVFFDDKELFSILADSCDIICELKHKEARDVYTGDIVSGNDIGYVSTHNWDNTDRVKKFDKYLNTNMTLKSLSKTAVKGFKRFHFKIDGRRKGLRFKEVLYINSMYLGWNITLTENSFVRKLAEHCENTWVYREVLCHSWNSAYLRGKVIESDLLPIERRGNMLYITEDGHKIGYWRLGKIFSMIFHSKDTLKDMSFTDTFSGDIKRFFNQTTRVKYALKCRASVIVHKIFAEEFVRRNIKCIDIENFYHSFGLRDFGGSFKVVKGPDISQYYCEDMYHILENCSPLSESCMRYNECCEKGYFNIYSANKNCEMLIYQHKNGGVMGRALLWTATNGHKTYKLMDRIYYCYESLQPLFFKWAKENNFFRKDRQSYDDYSFIKPDGEKFFSSYLYVKLEKSDFSYYPYCDTFHHLEQLNNRLYIGVNEEEEDILNLRCTGGGYEDNDNYIQLDYCDARVHIDDCCWSDFSDMYIHGDDCFYSDYDNTYIFCDDGCYCEDIEQDIHKDNAVYSDKEDCYYTSEGCVYSEFYQSFISTQHSIACEGDYVYEEDCEAIEGKYYVIGSSEWEVANEEFRLKYEESVRGGGDWNGVDNTIGEDLSKSLMNNEDKDLEA